jgi:hypothetical protein
VPFHDVIAGPFTGDGESKPFVEVAGGIVAQHPQSQGKRFGFGLLQGKIGEEFA